MRYRLMASYRGAPYEAGVGPSDGDVVLFAACPPPEELGFEPATGHWRKQLRVEEVQALWESRPVGIFRGERCIVLDDLGDRLHIAYLGHDAYQAEHLGFWQVDRGVFELVTPREEVTEIVEERLDYLPRAATAQPATAQPAAPGTGGAGAPRDIAVVPQAGEPPLPLEAAARRAASARVLQPAGPATPRQAPPAADPAPQPVPPVPQPAPPMPSMAQRAGIAPPAPPARGPAGPTPEAAPVPPAREAAPVPPGRGPAGPAREAAPVPPARGPAGPSGPVGPAGPAGNARQAAPPGPDRPPPAARRRRSALRRQATERIFSELASLAAIPPSAYAVGEEVDGAMCLIQTADGFEVFNAAAGARHEVRIFDDEESAYFYLFGVLAAEAVRTGRLAPQG
jgi:hypothetical protein